MVTESGAKDPFIGRVFKDAFEIEKKLGEGGFGAVYLAIQRSVDRRVAVKVLRPDRANDERIKETLIKRFRREAISTSKLNHPNTVRLIDFGEDDDGVLFLVLELLEGAELGDVLEQVAPLEPARVARICKQICKSLKEAHGHGIVHRDLKPCNVFLVDFDGNSDFVKVMDFGIASIQEADQDQKLTQTGMTQGTPRYMAPEQAMAQDTSPATDIYALGCMIYEMLTSQPVFDHETPLAVTLAHVREPAPALVMDGVADGVVREWNTLLARMLAKQPEDRPQEVNEVIEELDRLEKISEGVSAPSAPPVDDFGMTMPQTPAATMKIDPDGTVGGIVRPPEQMVTMGQTIGLSTSTEAMPIPKESPWKVGVAVAAALLLAGVGAFFALGGGDKGGSEGAAKASGVAAGTPTAVAQDMPESVEARAKREAAAKAERDKAIEDAKRSATEVARKQAEAELKAKADAAKPTTAHMNVVSEPTGAQVLRKVGSDQVLLCTTPCDLDVAPGAASEILEISKDGYEVQKVQALLTAGATFTQAYALSALKKKYNGTKAAGAPKPAGGKKPPAVKEPTAGTTTAKATTPKKEEKKKKLLPGFRDNAAPATKKKLLPKLRP